MAQTLHSHPTSYSAGGSGGREGLPSILNACRRWPLRNTGVTWLQPQSLRLLRHLHRSVRCPRPSSVIFRHQLRSSVCNPSATCSAKETSDRSEIAEALFNERCCNGAPSLQHLAIVANDRSESRRPQPSRASVRRLAPHFCTCRGYCTSCIMNQVGRLQTNNEKTRREAGNLHAVPGRLQRRAIMR